MRAVVCFVQEQHFLTSHKKIQNSIKNKIQNWISQFYFAFFQVLERVHVKYYKIKNYKYSRIIKIAYQPEILKSF